MAREHFFVLTLAVLGVIQALALANLAEKLPARIKSRPKTKQALYSINYFICILIIVRIFQTYVSAALQENIPWKLSFFDLFSMFAVGIFQYWIFETIRSNHQYVRKFYARVSLLGFIACSLHILALYRTLSELGSALDAVQRMQEIWLQLWNIALAISIAGACRIGLFADNDADRLLVSSVVAALLVATTSYSLEYTSLGNENQRTPTVRAAP